MSRPKVNGNSRQMMLTSSQKKASWTQGIFFKTMRDFNDCSFTQPYINFLDEIHHKNRCSHSQNAMSYNYFASVATS